MSTGRLGLTIGIAGITVVALAVRLFEVGAAGIWFDEAYHVALAREPTIGAMLDAILSNPPSAPLYALLLRWWIDVAGSSDTAIRIPSVVAGTLTVPAAAWLARELDGRAVSMISAAVFLAVSSYALEFSQEAAPYALASLATTAAIAAAWRWRNTGRPLLGVIAIGLGTVAAYTHYVAVAVLALVWLFGALGAAGPSRVPRRGWLLGGLSIGALWLPWLVALTGHWLDATTPRAALASPFAPVDVLRTLAQYVVGTAALLAGERLLLISGLVAGGILVALGWVAGGSPARRGLRVVTATAAVLLLAPAGVAYVTGAWVFVPHFGLLTLPATFVVCGAGVAELARIGRRAVEGRDAGRAAGTGATARPAALAALLPSIATIGLGALMIAGLVLFRQAPPHGADGLRELVSMLVADRRDHEPVLVAPAILMPSIEQYTDIDLTGIPRDFDLRDIYTPYARPAPDAAIAAATSATTAGSTRVWVISFDEVHDAGVVTAELGRSFDELRVVTFQFATLRLYERRS